MSAIRYFRIVTVAAREDRPQVNRGWLVRRFVARFAVSGRASRATPCIERVLMALSTYVSHSAS